MNDIILSPIPMSQFERFIKDAVKEANASSTKEPEPEPSDRLNADEACELLNRTRSWLFKKTMERGIPFSKFGSRLVFSRRELQAWMESQTIPVLNPSEVMNDRLAKAAKRRSK
jgi:excisionase family DNA binding protein